MEIVIKGTAKEMADLLREVTSLPDEKKHTLPSDEIPVHSHVVEDKRYQDLCREHLLNSIKNFLLKSQKCEPNINFSVFTQLFLSVLNESPRMLCQLPPKNYKKQPKPVKYPFCH